MSIVCFVLVHVMAIGHAIALLWFLLLGVSVCFCVVFGWWFSVYYFSESGIITD